MDVVGLVLSLVAVVLALAVFTLGALSYRDHGRLSARQVACMAICASTVVLVLVTNIGG